MLVLALLSPAFASPSLHVAGVCPGTNAVTLSGVTPSVDIAYITADGLGEATVPGGRCQGTRLALSANRLVVQKVDRSSIGGADFMNVALPEGLCGSWLQVLDLETCEVSNVALLAREQDIFRFAGSAHQPFVVPPGVETLDVIVHGAQGGDGDGIGGRGGTARGPLDVSGIDELVVVVGERGGETTRLRGGAIPDGGGVLGAYDYTTLYATGGGSSSVRLATGLPEDALYVGAGGGGGGFGGQGGDGGGLVGDDGTTDDPITYPPGGGATQTQGGSGHDVYAMGGDVGGYCRFTLETRGRGCGSGGGGWIAGGAGLGSPGGGGSSKLPDDQPGARAFTGTKVGAGEVIIRW